MDHQRVTPRATRRHARCSRAAFAGATAGFGGIGFGGIGFWGIVFWGIVAPLPPSSAQPPLWVNGQALPPADRDALVVLTAELAAHGELRRTLAPPDAAAQAAPGAAQAIARRLHTGLALFDEVQIEKSASELAEGLDALARSPWLSMGAELSPEFALRAVLAHVHAQVLLGRLEGAQATATWWWSLHPDAAFPEAAHPTAVRQLVTRVASALPKASLRIELRGGQGCDVVVNGVARPPHHLVTLGAGVHAVRGRCPRSEGWIRSVELRPGKVRVLPLAPHAEAAVDVVDDVWTWRPGLRREEWLALAADLAFALDSPVATASYSFSGGEAAIAVVAVWANGTTSELGRRPLGPASSHPYHGPSSPPVRAATAPGQPNATAMPLATLDSGGESSAEEPAREYRPWAIGTLAAGAALLGTAVGLHVWHDSAIGSKALTPSRYAMFADVRAAAIAGYAIGGASLAASGVLWLLDLTAGEDAPVAITPTPAGLGISGRF